MSLSASSMVDDATGKYKRFLPISFVALKFSKCFASNAIEECRRVVAVVVAVVAVVVAVVAVVVILLNSSRPMRITKQQDWRYGARATTASIDLAAYEWSFGRPEGVGW
mmetsp:Transcript_29360/g.71560  ORF Transcript_29360/g.71560 Transcript_29360/m.71560 type:complete len:109 (+) Transcript_29360:833-1159(+)